MTGDTHSEVVALSRMEVVEVGRRRRWSNEQKLRIVNEASAAGVSLRAVARRHDVAPAQIYDWRRKFFGPSRAARANGFAAVVVSPDNPATPSGGRMEVRCGNGRAIIVGRDVDVVVLAQLVAALER